MAGDKKIEDVRLWAQDLTLSERHFYSYDYLPEFKHPYLDIREIPFEVTRQNIESWDCNKGGKKRIRSGLSANYLVFSSQQTPSGVKIYLLLGEQEFEEAESFPGLGSTTNGVITAPWR